MNSTLLPDEAAQEFSSSMPQLIDGRQSRVGELRSVPRVSTPRPWESGLIMVKPYLGETKRFGFTVYCRYTVDKSVTPKDFVLYIWVKLRAGKMKRIRVLAIGDGERALTTHLALAGFPTLVPQKRPLFGHISNKSFVNRVRSVNTAGYWP